MRFVPNDFCGSCTDAYEEKQHAPLQVSWIFCHQEINNIGSSTQSEVFLKAIPTINILTTNSDLWIFRAQVAGSSPWRQNARNHWSRESPTARILWGLENRLKGFGEDLSDLDRVWEPWEFSRFRTRFAQF